MTGPRLLAIVLNYRTPEMCLTAAEAAIAALEGFDAELVIVDNDSDDGSFDILKAGVAARGWPQVRVLASGHNGGFGAGNNFGIRAGRADGAVPDYIYILNSDAFPEPGAIRSLVDWCEAHPDTGIAGGLTLDPDGTPHVTAFRFPSVASEFEHAMRFGPVTRMLRNSRVPMDLPAAPLTVDWLAGASLLLRREMLDRIGLFDERYFLYFEETDLCLRAARDNWQRVFLPDSRVTHIGSVSTGMKRWSRTPGYWLDSRLHYFTKNHGALYCGLATLSHVTGGVLWRIRRQIQRKPAADPPRFLRDLIWHALRRLVARVSPAGVRRRPKPQPAKRLP